MNRFISHLKGFGQYNTLSNFCPTSQVKHICTSGPVCGGIQIKKMIESRLLDTSRQVEIEETHEVNHVALSKDGRVIVCWHPELPFPYEMSNSLPIDTIPTESTLKIQALNPVREVFRKKHQRVMVQELMQLTNTPKYPWLTHKRPRKERYRKLNPLYTDRDREYL